MDTTVRSVGCTLGSPLPLHLKRRGKEGGGLQLGAGGGGRGGGGGSKYGIRPVGLSNMALDSWQHFA